LHIGVVPKEDVAMKNLTKIALALTILCSAAFGFAAAQPSGATATLRISVFITPAVSSAQPQVTKSDGQITFMIPYQENSTRSTGMQPMAASDWMKEAAPDAQCDAHQNGNSCGAQLRTETYVVR
jgi:hypothetical protein